MNLKEEDGFTSLHLAAENGYGKIVEILIQHKADVNVTDKTGLTPLQLAKQYGKQTKFKLNTWKNRERN